MKKIWVLMLLIAVTLVGCASTDKQAEMDSPQLLLSKENNFFVYEYMDRHYVVGSEAMSKKFAAHGHLPYTKTILGGGPHGETVVYEVAKKDPGLAERLIDTYQSTPFLVDSKGDDYAVFKYMGRLYVVGQAKTKASFAEHGHMPYTKTILGAGPAGETVVFEVDKKDPKLVEKLMEMFKG
jgi:hypothetical protein